MVYPWQGPVKAGKQLSGQFLTGLSFTGGCLFPALFYAAFLIFQMDQGLRGSLSRLFLATRLCGIFGEPKPP